MPGNPHATLAGLVDGTLAAAERTATIFRTVRGIALAPTPPAAGPTPTVPVAPRLEDLPRLTAGPAAATVRRLSDHLPDLIAALARADPLLAALVAHREQAAWLVDQARAQAVAARQADPFAVRDDRVRRAFDGIDQREAQASARLAHWHGPVGRGRLRGWVAARLGRDRLRVFADGDAARAHLHRLTDQLTEASVTTLASGWAEIRRQVLAEVAGLLAAHGELAGLPDPAGLVPRAGLSPPGPPRIIDLPGPAWEPAWPHLRAAVADGVRPRRDGESRLRWFVTTHRFPGNPGVWPRRTKRVADRDDASIRLASAWADVCAAARLPGEAWLRDVWWPRGRPYDAERATYLAGYVAATTELRDSMRTAAIELAAIRARLHRVRGQLVDIHTELLELRRADATGLSTTLRWALADLGRAVATSAVDAAGTGIGIGIGSVLPDLHAWASQAPEFRVTLVAPMKAGKSTVVNAIVGSDLLPSRNMAMTVLPTRVVVEPAGTRAEPELTIDPSTHARVVELAERLAGRGVRDRLTELARTNPHLTGPVALVAERARPVDPSAWGRGPVRQALADLNDLVRLAAHALPDRDAAELIGALRPPEVRVAVPWLATTGPGQLVLIDTPGPDEAAVSRLLEDILVAQLRHTHAVLVVLDAIRHGSTVDASARGLVDAPHTRLGPGRVHAVLNKLDVHHGDTVAPAAVLAVVARELRLETGEAATVHAISAELGLAAARALADSAGAVPALLKLVYPMEWERRLSTIGPAEVERLAEAALDRSRMTELINSTVRDWAARAGRHAVDTVWHILDRQFAPGPRPAAVDACWREVTWHRTSALPLEAAHAV